MREIKTHRIGDRVNDALCIEADERANQPVCSVYHVQVKMQSGWEKLIRIKFNEGFPALVKTVGERESALTVDGLSDESLLAIVVDRCKLRGVAAGSREHSLAITKMEEALHWLRAGLEGVK